MINHCVIQIKFSAGNHKHFRVYQLKTYTVLAKKVLAMLVSFKTTYVCKTGFSYLCNIKKKTETDRIFNIIFKEHAALRQEKKLIEGVDATINRKHQQEVIELIIQR